ncbi:hypothetical protein HYV43_00865 [Candidatus Micrarchaeota archaeon]|nr:hypothetical protein [Candidatus Micrarchaeota archaeon]
MQTLRSALKSLGYLHLDMGPLKLPTGLKRKDAPKLEAAKARLFTKDGKGDVSPQEARDVRRHLDEFKARQAEKSKTVSFYPHPRQDPRQPRTWVVLTE